MSPSQQLENVAELKPRPGSAPGLATGGDGGQIQNGMSERLAKIEGVCDGLRLSIEGLRHSQNMATGALGAGVGIGFLVVIFFLGYLLTRIDNLPSEFERLNQTLSQAITASKQQQPQVILVPTPITTQESSVPKSAPVQAPVAPSSPK
jgi:hypothetical protein